MSHLGYPAAAAVVAAPIRNEWDDMDETCWGFTLFRMEAKPALVRYLPSCQVNNGPVRKGCIDMNLHRAWTGQRGELFVYRYIVVPCLKGSVLDAFMCKAIDCGDLMDMSSKHRVVDGLYFLI